MLRYIRDRFLEVLWGADRSNWATAGYLATLVIGVILALIPATQIVGMIFLGCLGLPLAVLIIVLPVGWLLRWGNPMKRTEDRKNGLNVLNYREEVLNQIKEGDSWDVCLNLPVEHIANQLEWINDKLVLTTVKLSDEEDHYFRKILNRRGGYIQNALLTSRQEVCYYACVTLMNKGKIEEAYHEFYDFIDDCGRKGTFSSEIEIKGIKSLVDSFQKNIFVDEWWKTKLRLNRN